MSRSARTGFDTPEGLSWIEDRTSGPPANNAPPVSELTMESGEVLLCRGLLSDRQLAQVRAAQTNGARLDQIAVDQGLVSEEAALRALGDEMGLDFVDLAETPIDDSLLASFPQRLIHRHSLFPLRAHNGTLDVATSDPFDLYPLDELTATTGLTIEPVLATRRRSPGRSRPTWASAARRSTTCWPSGRRGHRSCSTRSTSTAELSEKAQEASVVRLVNEILLEAIESRASDVHIESQAAGHQGSLPHRRHACIRSRCRRRSTAFRPRSSAA